MGVFGDEPLVVCKLDNKKYSTGRATAKEASAWNPSAFSTNDGSETIHVEARPAKVIVLWENCQIDKFKSNNKRKPDLWFAAVAPVFPLTTVDEEEHRRAIIEMRNESRFPLPGLPNGPVQEDSYVDLRYMAPVRQPLLKANRVGAVTRETLDALHAHLFSFLTGRRLVESATCPGCGAAVHLGAPAKVG